MSYSQTEITLGDTIIPVYYSQHPLPIMIDGCIIAGYEIIYENTVPQRAIALKDGVDAIALDDVLMDIVKSVITLQPKYIGIKDGKPS